MSGGGGVEGGAQSSSGGRLRRFRLGVDVGLWMGVFFLVSNHYPDLPFLAFLDFLVLFFARNVLF